MNVRGLQKGFHCATRAATRGGGGGPSWPKVCNGYHEHHSHYLDGDPIGAPMLLPANGSVGASALRPNDSPSHPERAPNA